MKYHKSTRYKCHVIIMIAVASITVHIIPNVHNGELQLQLKFNSKSYVTNLSFIITDNLAYNCETTIIITTLIDKFITLFINFFTDFFSCVEIFYK